MTLIDLNLNEIMRRRAADVVCVNWSAMRSSFDGDRHRFGRESFVLNIEMLNASSAMAEAWVESNHCGKPVIPRTLVRVEIALEDGFMHMDLFQNADELRTIAKLTLRQSTPQHEYQLVFAQSPLLAEAGFAAGGYDPPTLKPIAKQQSAASA